LDDFQSLKKETIKKVDHELFDMDIPNQFKYNPGQNKEALQKHSQMKMN